MNPGSFHTEYSRSLRTMIDDHLCETLSRSHPARIRNAMKHAIEGGKRIRPMLLLISCAVAGGREEDALDAAVAVELLHTSSLIHDDIMDVSELRRGRQTLHTLYDIPTAILTGDAMIALAVRAIHEVRSPRKDAIVDVFTTAFVQTCEGQGYDLELSGRNDVDSAVHDAMVENKTAKLVEASAAIGAMIGMGDQHVVNLLRRFALNIGIAYQVRDDLLDVLGDEVSTGKPNGQDRRNGRTTYVSFAHPRRDVGTLTPESTAARLSALVTQYTISACSSLDALPAVPAKEYLRSLAGSLAERRM
jgi:geranylgeranyl diphosphate synthase, type I